MKQVKLWLPAVLLMGLAACQPKVVPQRPVVDYVSELIDERSDPGHQLLASFGEKDAAGDIVVFGPLDEVRPMSLALLSSDRFDNVDARPIKDSLPDFSGEVITRIMLTDPSVLQDYAADEGAALREWTVKAVLSSLDTLSYRTPNDLASFSHKTRGKLVILTSSAMAAYGKYDVDSLLRAFGLGSTVFYPFELMADKALAKPESRIGIVSSKPKAVYDEFFGYRNDARGHFIDVFPKETVLDPSSNIVDSLALDVLMLDDPAVRVDSLKVRFPDIRVVSPYAVTCEACYRAMRSRNIFTHRVAYPQWVTYTAIATEDSQFILIDSDDRELF